MTNERLAEITAEIEKNKDREALLARAEELSISYKRKGFHCSESAIRACSDVLELNLSEETIRCAAGFMGGGGNYGDRCGFMEAGIMIISYLYGRVSPSQEIWRNNYLVRQLHERFKERMGSIYCRDILTKEIEARGVEDCETCNNTFYNGAKVIVELVLDAEELLENIPAEEKAIDHYE